MPPIADLPVRRPLDGHVLFATSDLDEARERVARIFCPHQLRTQTPRARLAARHHHMRGESLSLNYIEYGAETLIEPGELGRFYLLQVPVSGGAEIRNGSDRYRSDCSRAALLNPDRPTRMIWHEGTAQLLVQIDRAALIQEANAQDRPLAFDGPLDLTTGPGMALARMLAFLVAEADRGGTPLGAGPMSRHLETALMAAMLSAHPSTAARMQGQGPVATSRHLRLAIDHIDAHLEEALSIHDIALAAGVGARALQLAFRQSLNTTPLGYWRDRRLDLARSDLATGEVTVTDVALRWGFGHFGRFARAFYLRHGMLPKDVLRRKV